MRKNEEKAESSVIKKKIHDCKIDEIIKITAEYFRHREEVHSNSVKTCWTKSLYIFFEGCIKYRLCKLMKINSQLVRHRG